MPKKGEAPSVKLRLKWSRIRMTNLSPRRRRAIALHALSVRWAKYHAKKAAAA
jgi:hypothetical protein